MRILPTLAVTATLALVGGPVQADPKKTNPYSIGPGDSYEVTVRAGKGRLGFAAIEISPELRAHFGAPSDAGILVDKVRPDSPAAKAGLKPGDVVIEADASRTTTASEILDALGDRKKGDKVPLVVIRSGKRTTLTATLEDDPGPAMSGLQWHKFDDTHKFDDFQQGRPFFGGDDDMKRAMERMQKQLEELERRMNQNAPKSPPGTTRT